VISHLARDAGLSPPLTGIYLNIALLLDPSLVPTEYTALYLSRDQNKNAPILPSEAMAMYAEAYEPTLTSPLWSPAIWPTGHKDLPPTYFQICGMDILRDEALIYERMLRVECGIETRVDVYPGLPHVFYANFPDHPRAKGYAGDTARGIGWLLGVSKMV
jgi:acetyl esterase/lipase